MQVISDTSFGDDNPLVQGRRPVNVAESYSIEGQYSDDDVWWHVRSGLSYSEAVDLIKAFRESEQRLYLTHVLMWRTIYRIVRTRVETEVLDD